MPIHPFDNTTVTSPSVSSPNTAYTIGTRFGLTAPEPITGIRWYRGNTNALAKPNNLKLWRGDGTLLKTIVAPVDNGAVGWQLTNLDEPVTPSTSVTYVVSADWPNGQNWFYLGRAAISAPPSPFLWDDNIRSQLVGAYGYPNGVDNTLAWLIEPEIGGTPSGGGGGTGGTVPEDLGPELARWFSSSGSVNEHETDGLPWLTNAVVVALSSSFSTVVGGLGDVANGTGTAMARLRQIAQDTAALLGRVPTTITTGFDQLFSWFGSAGLPAGTDTIPTGIQAIRDALNADVGVELLRQRLDLSPSLLDETRWRLVGTTTGEGDGVVADQADLYVLTLTAIPLQANHQPIGLYEWTPRWGWVAPLVHGYATERQFHDFDQVAITAGGLFMSGLLVHTSPGWEWVVGAWVLDRPE